MKGRVWFLLSLFAISITWLYVHRILGPQETSDPDGNSMIFQMGDLYPRWVGTRDLLLYGRNPYGPEVSHEIQLALYGHTVELTNGKPGDSIVDEQRFAYPVYVVFLMAPTVYTDFPTVRTWAPLPLALLTILSVLLYLDLLRWRLGWEAAAAIVLFTLSSPQIVQGLRHQQLALVVGCLLPAAAWCVAKNRLASAGALLALSTIKPQMALLPLCWFLIWSMGDRAKRWRLPAAFAATLAVLVGAGELILPGWLTYFFASVNAYRRYFPTSSLLRLALGDTLGEIVGGLIVLALLAVAWRNRKQAGNSPRFFSILAAFFIGAILAFPLFTPFNQVMLILPAMLIVRDWKAFPRLSRIVFMVSVSWPWIAALALLLFPPPIHSSSQLPFLPSFLVSFTPLFLPLLLMTRKKSAPRLPLPATAVP